MTVQKLVLYTIAIVVGVYHLWLAFKAIFVFRNDEPLSLWIFTLAGPLSTLPASVTGIYNSKIGGLWLVCGAIVSFVAAMFTAGSNVDIDTGAWFLKMYSGPMLLLGIAFIALYYWQKRFGAH